MPAGILTIFWNPKHADQLWSWNAPENTHLTAYFNNSITGRISDAKLVDQGSTERRIVIKSAVGVEQVEKLNHEYELYSRDLRHLQGSIIPKCYGIYTGRKSSEYWSVLLLEYCDGAALRVTSDNRHLAFQAMQNLHAAGISHEKITRSNHLLLHSGGLRIISFSRAKRHKCSSSPGLFCEELIESEREFGALQDRENITELLKNITMSADHATRWGFHSHKEIIQ